MQLVPVVLRPNSITLPGRRPRRRPGFQPVADRFELSQHVEIARTCLRPAFDPKSSTLVADPHELVESQVGNQVCDLDSVMEFGL